MTLHIIEHTPNEPIHYSVICLHGLGASGDDLAPLAQEFNLPGVRFVFPTAPTIPITVNHGMRMPAWYDITTMDFNARTGAPELTPMIQEIHTLIANEQSQHGIAPENVFLMGFSQGGAMAIEIGLHFPEKIAGIVALSCYAPRGEHTFEMLAEANSQTPVFLAHGERDDVVPLSAGESLRDNLIQRAYSVDWHGYPMRHDICGAEISDIKKWFERRLEW